MITFILKIKRINPYQLTKKKEQVVIKQFGAGSFLGKGNLKPIYNQDKIYKNKKRLKDVELEREILKK